MLELGLAGACYGCLGLAGAGWGWLGLACELLGCWVFFVPGQNVAGLCLLGLVGAGWGWLRQSGTCLVWLGLAEAGLCLIGLAGAGWGWLWLAWACWWQCG